MSEQENTTTATEKQTRKPSVYTVAVIPAGTEIAVHLVSKEEMLKMANDKGTGSLLAIKGEPIKFAEEVKRVVTIAQ